MYKFICTLKKIFLGKGCATMMIFLLYLGVSAQPQVTLTVQESAGGCDLETDCANDIICVDIVMSVNQAKTLDSYNIWVEYDGSIISREAFGVNNNTPTGDNSCVIANGVQDTDLEGPPFNPDHWRVSGVPGMGFPMMANTPYIVHTICFVILQPNLLEGQPICVGGNVATLLTTVTFTDSSSDTDVPESCMILNNSFSSCTILAEADLAITKSDSPDPVLAGQNITYTISVVNNGPSDAQNTEVSDVLPAGLSLVSATPSQGTWSSPLWSIGTLLSGETATLVLVASTSTTLSGMINNAASVYSTTTDTVAANNTDTATTIVDMQFIAVDDSFNGPFETPVMGNVSVNDSSPSGSLFDDLTLPVHGTLIFNSDGMFTYVPDTDFVGMDTFTYIVCLPPPNNMVCDTATVIITIDPDPCVTVFAWVYLEGAAIDPEGFETFSVPMRTDLNDLRVLPGQALEDIFYGIKYSPPGQPYSVAPWNYLGTEGDSFDSGGDPAMGDAGYPVTAVDWVLVSLRADAAGSTGPVCQAAALLHNDGHIEFVEPFNCCEIDLSQSYFLVVEHRNHLIVMSHEAVPVLLSNSSLTYDFRSQQSYINDPMGFDFFSGQKEIATGIFAMIAGNGNQVLSNQSDTDINFDDEISWKDDNGDFGFYRIGDYNLNGDSNFNDRVVWEHNNGKFTSVPRD
jgi:uncharacterized repeat protein (TIGR01451 family)